MIEPNISNFEKNMVKVITSVIIVLLTSSLIGVFTLISNDKARDVQIENLSRKVEYNTQSIERFTQYKVFSNEDYLVRIQPILMTINQNKEDIKELTHIIQELTKKIKN